MKGYLNTVVSRKYAPPPPFCNLSLSIKCRGGAYTRDATIFLAITPSFPIKHDSIIELLLSMGSGGQARGMLPTLEVG